MFNTLYSIAGGIALAVGALGASDDFDGAQLAQNAFFCPEEESEVLNEQEAATEDVLVAKDVNEWNEMADEYISSSLAGSDELSDDEKLELAVLTGDISSDVPEKTEEVSQIEEKTQPEGLSEEEFYSMLEHQFNDAMTALESKEEIAAEEPLIIEVVKDNMPETEEIAQEAKEDVVDVKNDDLTPTIEFQPEEANSENALANSEPKVEDAEKVAQTENDSEQGVKEETPWVVSRVGLPDIPNEDMNALTNQATKVQQAVETEQITVEEVSVQDIPVMESLQLEIPEDEALEFDSLEPPVFDDSENIEEVEETKAEAVEAEEAETEEAEETVETEADDLSVEPLEDDAAEVESDDEALVIPSTEIPPVVITEEQREEIRAEIDAIVDQSENFDSWIPRQIPVSGSVEEIQPQTKPEDDFILEYSRKNAKEFILENTGIDLK